MEESSAISFGSILSGIGDGIVSLVTNIIFAFYNLVLAGVNARSWLDWLSWGNTTEDKQSLMRFVYYGGSVEFFFVVFTAFLSITFIGIWRRDLLWACVRGLETMANGVGRFFAWAGLLMVVQQVLIVVMQRIFTRPDIALGFGLPFAKDISWYAEELKLYNALVVALCATYTFVQGGHVRVDLLYARVSFKTKRLIDMAGSVLFMMPLASVVWMYGWFFMWRHLIVPKPSASDTLERLVMKARALRWNVEIYGPSPNGFTGYFIFKILLVAFAGMVFLHACAFFWRSFLEWREGEASENKYLDKDTLGEGEEAYEGTH